jgi:glycosyltransferase involved in cell wall biosynthesis
MATLLRSTYPSALASLRRQTFKDFQLMARADPGNEYIARNRAAAKADGEWLVFMDDDAIAPPDWLQHLDALVTSRPELVAVSGPLRGDMFGSGVMTLDKPGWWVGANLAVRKDVFLERPFEETWGLDHVPRGWRADSDLGFSIEGRYPGRWLHDGQWIMDHPGKMQSIWDPEVEDVFFQRWRKQYLERFIPLDPRGQQFLLDTQILTPEERTIVLNARKQLRKAMPNLPVLPQEA